MTLACYAATKTPFIDYPHLGHGPLLGNPNRIEVIYVRFTWFMPSSLITTQLIDDLSHS